MIQKIFSIIVTFNPDLERMPEVMRCHLKTAADGIVIIDNGSSNIGALEDLLNEYQKDKVQTHFLDTNQGLGYAQNLGIEVAKKHGCTHVILFDQDSVVPKELVSVLVEDEQKLASQHIKVGAVGPRFFDTRTRNFYPQIRIKGLGVEKVWPNASSGDPIEVSFIIASGSLIRLSTFADVGPINDEFFIDCIDIEWCLRAANKGYRIFVSQNVEISHTIGDERRVSLGREISEHSPLRKYYMMRNNLLLSRLNWIPWGYRIRMAIFTILKLPVYMYDVKFNKRQVRYIMKGIYDGLLNRAGAYKQ